MSTCNILCIESSYNLCSVAIITNHNIYTIESKQAQNHAESLLSLIQECLEMANLAMLDLHAIAISSGPGSYTGLRIGTSTAKGICFALNIPLIAIDTLMAIAYGVTCLNVTTEGLIWPMIDARRMEVYHCVFDSKLNRLTPINNGIIGEEGFIPELVDAKTVICGDGAIKAEQIMGFKRYTVEQHAKWMCNLAEKKYSMQEFEDLDKFEPLYLKFANITVSKK